MPVSAGILETHRRAVRALSVGDQQDLRMVRQQELAHDVHDQLAEPAAEGDMLGGGEALVAEDDDTGREPCLSQRREFVPGERPREVDPHDLRRETVPEPVDLERHPASLLECARRYYRTRRSGRATDRAGQAAPGVPSGSWVVDFTSSIDRRAVMLKIFTCEVRAW